MLLGTGFFRPDSRPARDLGVLLAQSQAWEGPLSVLDLMTGCGIRALRYGLEAGAEEIWANDADTERLPLVRLNLEALPAKVAWRCSSLNARDLLAGILQSRQRFALVDLDAFRSPAALVPLALEAVAPGGVLYLTSSDGRAATGHDRSAAVRRLGAAARAHPASWELALRLQLGVIARAAWAQGRDVEPLLSFSEGRTFRTVVRLPRTGPADGEQHLGMVAHCPRCGDQQVQSLLYLRPWAPCLCGKSTLSISGPLWIGPLQHPATLRVMEGQARMAPASVSRPTRLLLDRLISDPGHPSRCWPVGLIGRCLGQDIPSLARLTQALQQEQFYAVGSGIMPSQLRSDAPWPLILAKAQEISGAGAVR